MACSTHHRSHHHLELTSLVAIFVFALIGAQSNVGGSSIMDQMPFGNIRELMNKGSQVVGAIRATASLAYNDISNSISGLSLEQVQNNLLETAEPITGRLSAAYQLVSGDSNGNNDDNSANQNCTRQFDESGNLIGYLCPPKDPDAKRNVAEIIRSRGFQAEEYEVHTKDGYILTIQRVVNPLIDPSQRRQLKPVILQHGLMSSSVDWVINSVDVRPSKFPRQQQQLRATTNATATTEANSTVGRNIQNILGDTQEEPNSLGFYLANEGYDVFLGNSRGNIYGQRHERLSTWDPSFWSFTFDEQIKYDLPDTIEFVQNLTGHTKVGYVGHSQGTTMALGLLADQPNYADVLEPVVLLAPVAYVAHCHSPVKYFAVYTPIFSHINLWFASSNMAVRYLAPIVCDPKVIRRDICANLIFLATGFDESQFNDTRVTAYLNHMPSGTSVKNIAHWGQEVLSGRFAHFDHGVLGNQARYGTAQPPDYHIGKIRSKSLALFTAQNDWLASPEDVAKLRAELREPLVKFVNVTESLPAWNHIDFLYGKDCGRLVNKHVVEVFHQFDGQ